MPARRPPGRGSRDEVEAVVLLRWPDEAEERAALHRAARPRLLLLAEDEPPPAPIDDLEDWVRLPVSDEDLRARVRWLLRRAVPEQPPALDDDGVLVSAGSSATLPPVEARLTRALLDRYCAVVTRDALARAGWPDGAPGRNALDVHVLRLRRRLAPLGLTIHTVRNRGYRLERAPASGGADVP
jgi:hypothetical protein